MLFRSDRKSTRLNSSHTIISYAVFCLKKTTPRRRHFHSRTCNPLTLLCSPLLVRGLCRIDYGGVGWSGGLLVGVVVTELFFFLGTGPPPGCPFFPPPPLSE